MLKRIVRWALRLVGPKDVTAGTEPRERVCTPVASAALELPAKGAGVAASGIRTIAALNAKQTDLAAPAKFVTPSTRPIDAATAAAEFVTWGQAHGLADREWPVDALWFLVSEDFAPALGFGLPPRRVFLGALQRRSGVAVVYDRRVYARDGRLKGKTTVYRLPSADRRRRRRRRRRPFADHADHRSAPSTRGVSADHLPSRAASDYIQLRATRRRPTCPR